MSDTSSPLSGLATEEIVPPRVCGDCSLCCTVLRVDALQKLGGIDCLHQDINGPGCSIHAKRPRICRAYRCAWLKGSFGEADRPDRIGAVLDFVSSGATVQLEIHESEPGVFEREPRLQAIAEGARASMPVRIRDSGEVLDADRPFLLLMPNGESHRVSGEWTEVRSPPRASGDPEVVVRRRLPLLERSVRRLTLKIRRWRLRDYRGASPSEEKRTPSRSSTSSSSP
ncbi:YkgJ family cysteine cluster protein [Myxococcota bacterium]|nr:YkgJ family cysteine cluster protein [Myxococcota bacterium]